MDEDTEVIKKPSRTRKISKTTADEDATEVTPIPTISQKSFTLNNSFSNLIDQINQLKQDFEALQQEINKTRKVWEQEKEEYVLEVSNGSQLGYAQTLTSCSMLS